MEIMRGKSASFIDTAALDELVRGYETIHVDLGTGDGRYVQHLAQSNPKCLVIGIDACRENLHEVSRRAPTNALFVIANAQDLPRELNGLADTMTINFPWGSLVEGLLDNDPGLMASLERIICPKATIDVRLNGGALAQAGWSLEAGSQQVRDVLMLNGFKMRPAVLLSAQALKACPTTWAKRLAFGRDPRAMYLTGSRIAALNSLVS